MVRVWYVGVAMGQRWVLVAMAMRTDRHWVMGMRVVSVLVVVRVFVVQRGVEMAHQPPPGPHRRTAVRRC